jgi:hypothetical protein
MGDSLRLHAGPRLDVGNGEPHANIMSNPQNVPQVWEFIEAANDAEECHVRFSLWTKLGVFHTSHEGPFVHVQLHDSSGECRNQELADIIRAKGKEVMREAANRISTPR